MLGARLLRGGAPVTPALQRQRRAACCRWLSGGDAGDAASAPPRGGSAASAPLRGGSAGAGLQSDAAATAARLEELLGAAARVVSLGDQGLLTPTEAGNLSVELADCLRLHRQYLAAIEAHAAVSISDCARAFECDRQLAHILRTGDFVGRLSQAAGLPPSPPQLHRDNQLSSPEADDPVVCRHSVLTLSDIEKTMGDAMPSSSQPQPAASSGGDGEVPPWPWDPQPGDSVQPQ